MKIIEMSEQFITLGQALKLADVISSGGMAKWYLQEHIVYVDGELENRRGRKLYHGAMIDLVDEQLKILVKQV